MITPKQEKFLHFAQKAFNQDDLISLLKKKLLFCVNKVVAVKNV